MRYEADLVSVIKSEAQKLYKYVRSQLKVKARVGPLETQTGELTQNDEEVAEELSRFFKSVFVDEDDTNVPNFAIPTSDSPALTSITVTSQYVLEELRKLDISKAAEPDGFPAVLLK